MILRKNYHLDTHTYMAILPYMKTTLYIDDSLLRQAMEVSRLKTKTEVVALGLQEIIRKHKLAELARMRGSLPRMRSVRRRRS